MLLICRKGRMLLVWRTSKAQRVTKEVTRSWSHY